MGTTLHNEAIIVGITGCRGEAGAGRSRQCIDLAQRPRLRVFAGHDHGARQQLGIGEGFEG